MRSLTRLLSTAMFVAAFVPLARLSAQQASVSVSLDDALRMARAANPTVDIARSGVVRAAGQLGQARSQYLPQLAGTGGYTKTLKSQFSGLSFGGPPVDTTVPTLSVCSPRIPAHATPAQVQAALNAAATCPSSGGFNLSQAGFGVPNQYALGLSLSQNLFTGGRLTGTRDAANAQLRSASVEVGAQQAQLALTVTQSYYDAVLADQLVTIADSALAETAEILAQTKLERQVGNVAEYDLLRAQVARDNQVPVLLQQQSNRQVAYLRLKQLLNLRLDDSVQLTTTLQNANAPALPAIAAGVQMDTMLSDRAPVRETEEALHAQEAQLKVARSERYPTLAISSAYQRLYYPTSVLPQLSDPHENWTIGVTTSFPIYTGGKIRADAEVAEAGVAQARAQLRQTRDAAALDTRVSLNLLAQADAAWRASQGTADQAQRAYNIDQIRYREGLSTQTDLAQTRLLLEQALANHAQATRDLAVARVRLALLRDLPLQNAAAGAASGSGASGGGAPQQSTQAQQLTQPASGQGATMGSIQP